MPALSRADMLKTAGKGPYTGQSRVAIMSLKIKDNRPFILGASKTGKKVFGLSYDEKSESLVYFQDATKRKTLETTRSKIFKDPDFGGGAGSGGGAEETKITESLQCFFCAYVFAKRKKIDEKKPPTDKELETVTKGLCFTTKTLKDCLEKGPIDWIENKVYIRTANKLYEKFSSKFTGRVFFHRAGAGSGPGSKFMDNIYVAKKVCQDNDKASGDPQAPGSFSNDKWNPGDIWMTTFANDKKPLENFTSNWGQLNNQVKLLAEQGKVLGISLKKLRTARLYEYNKDSAISKQYTYKGFVFGRNGDFFSSNDIYLKTSDNEVQLRTFNETSSWQGEIKGVSAAGGKVGGGNINFYLKQVFGKTIFTNSEVEVITEAKSNRLLDTMYALYKKYNPLQTGVKVSTISKDEFAAKLQDMKDSFKISKLIGLKFLDAFLSTQPNKRNDFITRMYLYASSATEQSSYFVKLAD